MKMNIEELQTSDFEKLSQTVYRDFIQSNTNLDKLIQPSFRLAVFPNLEKNKIISRDFKTEYLDERDQVGGNLYKWIHQSFSVLFEVDKENMEIVLYSSTINTLASRFATLLKMNSKTAIDGTYALCITLALVELFENRIDLDFKQMNNLFDNNPDYMKIHARFRAMFEKDLISDL